MAVFGTGNIVSISSFEISSTYRFVTVFNPFLMAALLIFKLVIPNILVGCVYHLINQILRVNEAASFFIVTALGNIMSLNFFFLVKVCDKFFGT